MQHRLKEYLLNENFFCVHSINAECRDAERDKNGKCPGETGYVSFSKEVVKDFATYQAEQKAKKAAAAAAAAEKK